MGVGVGVEISQCVVSRNRRGYSIGGDGANFDFYKNNTSFSGDATDGFSE